MGLMGQVKQEPVMGQFLQFQPHEHLGIWDFSWDFNWDFNRGFCWEFHGI